MPTGTNFIKLFSSSEKTPAHNFTNDSLTKILNYNFDKIRQTRAQLAKYHLPQKALIFWEQKIDENVDKNNPRSDIGNVTFSKFLTPGCQRIERI